MEVSYKIRKAETHKIPIMAICGKREKELRTVSVRQHGGKELGLLSIEKLLQPPRAEDES